MPIPSPKKVMKEEPETIKVETRPGHPTLKLKYTYLIKSETEHLPYDLVLDAVNDGIRGMCITRVFPDIVKRKLGEADVPVIWLSSTAKEECVRPKDLEKLSLMIEQFMETGPCIILLDGIDYLMTNNEFKSVLRLIEILADLISVHDSILLVTMPPGAIDENYLHLIERGMDEII